MIVLRHTVRTLADLVLYAGRSGQLWMPLLVVALAGATALVLAVKTVVPPAVYVLF